MQQTYEQAITLIENKVKADLSDESIEEIIECVADLFKKNDNIEPQVGFVWDQDNENYLLKVSINTFNQSTTFGVESSEQPDVEETVDEDEDVDDDETDDEETEEPSDDDEDIV